MLKKIRIKHFVLSTMTVFAFIGCGEVLETVEDRPTPPADEISYENQGRYVDENVSGIYYSDCNVSDTSCKSEMNGTTTDDGTFGFILGKPIYFSVAGLQLDTVASKYLVANGVVITVPETNGRLASFLQSMDNDGNANNGIKIIPEVVQALKDLNVSEYTDVDNENLDIETLVSQVQAKLDENTSSDETPSDETPSDENQTVPQKLQKSTITLRYVNESEALEHLRATISKYKPSPSITVKDVIEKIRDLGDNADGYTEAEIQAKVKAIRTQLDNPLEEDRNSRDIEIAQALMDLSELT